MGDSLKAKPLDRVWYRFSMSCGRSVSHRQHSGSEIVTWLVLLLKHPVLVARFNGQLAWAPPFSEPPVISGVH